MEPADDPTADPEAPTDAAAPASGRARWQAAFDASSNVSPTVNGSGVGVLPVYAPDDPPANIGWPGDYPYTRGPYASMYRSQLWTMRQFAGFGTAEDTNAPLQGAPARAGGSGLSTAFDMPTLHGPRLRRPAVASARSAGPASPSTRSPTWRTCSPTSTSAQVTTSMTINSPAAILLGHVRRDGRQRRRARAPRSAARSRTTS